MCELHFGFDEIPGSILKMGECEGFDWLQGKCEKCESVNFNEECPTRGKKPRRVSRNIKQGAGATITPVPALI